jgi:hypothetical protein
VTLFTVFFGLDFIVCFRDKTVLVEFLEKKKRKGVDLEGQFIT